MRATVEAGRATAQLLQADRGAKTRDKIADYLEVALDELAAKKDHATLAKIAKVAGEQVHVQAFAKRRDAEDQAKLTDLVQELMTLRTELAGMGFELDEPVSILRSTQVVDSTGEPFAIEAVAIDPDPEP